MSVRVMLGKGEELVFVSREVGLEILLKVLLKDFNVASVRMMGAAEPSKECSFNVIHRHSVQFNPNVVDTEAIQDGAFRDPECKRGRYIKPRVIWTRLLNVEYSK